MIPSEAVVAPALNPAPPTKVMSPEATTLLLIRILLGPLIVTDFAFVIPEIPSAVPIVKLDAVVLRLIVLATSAANSPTTLPVLFKETAPSPPRRSLLTLINLPVAWETCAELPFVEEMRLNV